MDPLAGSYYVESLTDELSIPSPDYAGMERGQVARLAKARAALASVGEISDALAGAWGRYVPA